MVKYFSVFSSIICCLCFFNLAAGYDDSAQPIEQVISYAREYRVNPMLTPEEEQQRLKEILSNTYEILPRYETNSGSLSSAVEEFVKDTLLTEVGDTTRYTVIDARTTEFYGKSHDVVFLVQDSEGKVHYVVKAFQNPHQSSGRFLPEISAMDLIQCLNYPGTNPIEPLGMAACLEGSEVWGLLLESAAPGKRLDQYVTAIAQETENSETRKQLFDIAVTAFKRMGESLAGLHSVTSQEKLKIHPSLVAKYDDKFNKVLKDTFITSELTKYFPLSQLKQYVNSVKAAALEVPLYRTYAHGDTNLGNVFLDETSGMTSFIDLYAMHQSVDINGVWSLL